MRNILFACAALGYCNARDGNGATHLMIYRQATRLAQLCQRLFVALDGYASELVKCLLVLFALFP